MYRTKLSKVKCGRCQMIVPLRLWREHVLQHKSLKILKLTSYPPSFLQLTKHYCEMLEGLDRKDRRGIAQLTSAYDTLKMLYFKDFKECSDDSPIVSPSFQKMAEALAPQNFNYSSWENESDQDTVPPAPYSFGLKIRQLQESLFHSEELLQELRQTFFTADPVTPELSENEGVLWGCCLFEGMKGNAAARHVTENYWDSIREILANNSFPSPPDIRRAMKKSIHKLDVSLRQGHEEVGQSRWSGVTGCACILQTTPLADPSDLENSRASTKLSETVPDVGEGSMGMLHITNIGSIAAVLSRGGTPKQITFTHTVADKGERERVVSNGGAVSSSGQVNCVTTVTRALGFHGDPVLRQCLSQKPYCNTIPLLPTDEFLIVANSTFWKYLGPKEACSMCKTILKPSLRKLVHVYTTIPGQEQDDALSQTSSLDYDALVSDFGDESKDSSMVPDNESEKNVMLVKFNSLIKMATSMLAKKFEEQNEKEKEGDEKERKSRESKTRSGTATGEQSADADSKEEETVAGEEVNWSEMFDDPLENLTLDHVCRVLSENMSNCLVDGAQQAGALGPIAVSVMLLPGSLELVKRRLYYEQTIHELRKMYNDYAISDVSLMSSNGDDVSVISALSATPLVPPSTDMLDQYDLSQSPTSMVSRQFPVATVPEETSGVVHPEIAEHMTLDPGKLVFRESCGVLKLARSLDKASYNNLKMEALKLDDVNKVLTKQDQRQLVKDMVNQVVQDNTSPEATKDGEKTPTPN